MNGATILPESTNSSAWTDYETALFDVLEALKPHFPQIAGGFARMTGGVDRDYIVGELRAAPATSRFQERVQPWLLACFGELIAGDREERNHRFLEEALELVQSCGCTAHEAQQLVDYVYGRPAGQPSQEVGGVMATLAALCLANDLDMHTDAETELARIWTKVDAIRAKQAAKPKHSPLPATRPHLVWSNEHQAWWGADHCGYTRIIDNAGRYDRDEAFRIAGTRGGGWRLNSGNPGEIAIPEQDAIDQYALISREQASAHA